MMKRFLSLSVLGLLLAGAVTGCAFGAGEGRESRDNRAMEELDRLRQQMTNVTGTWVGTLNRSGQIIALQVIISGSPVQTGGRDANGNPIYTLETTVTITSPDDPGRYRANMKGDYFPSSAKYQLVLNNPSTASPDDLRSLELRHEGAGLRGPLYSVSQYLGEVTLTRQGGQSGNEPPVDEEDRVNEQERRIYRKVTGFYYGPTQMTSGECRSYNVCVELSIQEEQTPRGGWKARLKGYTYREDIGVGSFAGERNLGVSYNYRSRPESMVLTSKNVTPQPNPTSPYTITMTLNFGTNRAGDTDFNLLTGGFSVESLGQTGTIRLRKVLECPKRPEIGRCNTARVR